MKRFLCLLLLLAAGFPVRAADHRVRGRVTDAAGSPVPGAVVRLDADYLWALTDTDGRFVFDRVETGSYWMETGSLGYAPDVRTLRVDKPVDGLEIVLQ